MQTILSVEDDHLVLFCTTCNSRPRRCRPCGVAAGGRPTTWDATASPSAPESPPAVKRPHGRGWGSQKSEIASTDQISGVSGQSEQHVSGADPGSVVRRTQQGGRREDCQRSGIDLLYQLGPSDVPRLLARIDGEREIPTTCNLLPSQKEATA
jgi:hypothetical protein